MNTFVYEIGRDEESLDKRQKIDSLRLSDNEWSLVSDLLALLAVSSILISPF